MFRKNLSVFKKGLSIILCMMMLFAICPSFLMAQTVSCSSGTETAIADAGYGSSNDPNGEILVYVFDDNNWIKAGNLRFSEFLSQKKVNLDKFASSGFVNIRLIKNGGGAGHLDSVLMGTEPPVLVNGEDKMIQKLSKTDFDLINIEQNGVELSFRVAEDATLAVTARVEGETISRTPFQLPLANLYQKIGEDSSFYNYRLNSVNATPNDGEMSGFVCEKEPFFREYLVPGTGHPSGYIYGWVINDGTNLYAALDFTSDNTLDGDKDYAKLYAKTPSGIKEFKVSANNTTWGQPHFIYTDKVPYQHKFYEFVIPLGELGVTGSSSDALSLAFSAYGTAAAGSREPALAYNPRDNVYLSVYNHQDYYGNEGIYGQLIKPDGTPAGQPVQLCNNYSWEASPSVAFDSVNEKFLVVWDDQFREGHDVVGRFISRDGTPQGESFFISPQRSPYYCETEPSVAFDSYNNKFLVVYSRYSSTDDNTNIYGCYVDSGGPVGDEIVISDAENDQDDPAVSFDPSLRRFLVAWEDTRSEVATSVYGQFVNSGGTLDSVRGNFAISHGEEQQDPEISYDSNSNRFLAVWADELDDESWDSEICGQLINADGAFNGTNFEISDQELCFAPSAAFDSGGDQFLVIWHREDYDEETALIQGRFLDPNGTAKDPSFDIASENDWQINPALAFAPENASFLAAFESGSYYSSIIIDYRMVSTGVPTEIPLRIVSTEPADNAANVAVNTPITIAFNKNITESANIAGMSINTGDTVVNFVYAIDNNTLTLTPSSNFAYGTGYSVSIPAGAVKAVEGSDLENPYTFSFTTVNSSVNPDNGGRNSGGSSETPPVGILIDRMSGYVSISTPVKIDQIKNEIVLDFDKKALAADPLLTAKIYYWNSKNSKWVALATYPAGDGKVKAVNDGGYKGWFKVFGVLQPAFTDVLGHWAEPVINRMNGLGMIEGYASGNNELTRLAKPDQDVTRTEFAAFLYRMLTIDPGSTTLPAVQPEKAAGILEGKFKDAGQIQGWASQMVASLVSAGHIEGRNGKFDGDAPITRIEAAVMVSSALKALPGYKPADLAKFSDAADVPEWAKAAVADNLINGYPDGTLKPNDTITRAETLTVLQKLFINGMDW